MKIAQLCAVDFTLYHFLLPLMRAMRAAGHEVVGIASDGPLLDKVRAEGFRVETVAIDRSYNLLKHRSSYRALRDLFRRERFDIVHVHTPVAALVGRAAAWRARVPRIVYTAHGFYFHEHMAWWKRAAFVVLEWLGGRVTDVLFTQAEEDAATARRLRLARGPVIQAIGNGVDAARFAPAIEDSGRRRDCAPRSARRSERVVILMIGRLVAEKGYPELIEAMRACRCGALDCGRALGQRPCRLDRRCHRAPQRPIRCCACASAFSATAPTCPTCLRAADIFTLPSHREGMPRSIIEAMMCGLPVIGTNIRGTREEIVAGETGALVPVRDPAALAAALNRLVADGALRRAWGEAGRARALRLYREEAVIERQLKRLGLQPSAARL